MKAFIINSGRGRRMEEMTENIHKSMVTLANGETIFERQIRILSECGIDEFIVTVGYLKEQLTEAGKRFPGLNFTFVENPDYDTTNAIYSVYLADKHMNGDMLFLHGDLVFNKRLITDVLKSESDSLCLINEEKALPEKDFKGRVEKGLLKEISVSVSGENCFALQPLYKLSEKTVAAWKDEIKKLVENGTVTVYAEDALNNLLGFTDVEAFSYRDYYIDEIDDAEDYKRVSDEIRYYDYREQEIYKGGSLGGGLDYVLGNIGAKKALVVASNNRKSIITDLLRRRGVDFVTFSGFSPNPKREEVEAGIDIFKKERCDFIISVGGGSCIDTAKCIKLFSKTGVDFDNQNIGYAGIKHLAVPTTAGSGSESTRAAVVYQDGEKKSVTHDSILPDYVILDHAPLLTLPEYHKKAAMLDAFCQAIESYWSKGAAAESREYSKKAIELILLNYEDYLGNKETGCENILLASNYSGKAINITATTAPHAMSYKLTSLYGIGHGHAVGLCLPYVWEYMYEKADAYPDEKEHLLNVFSEIATILKCQSIPEAIESVKSFFAQMALPDDFTGRMDIGLLAGSVNKERLGNNPMKLNHDDLIAIYTRIKNRRLEK